MACISVNVRPIGGGLFAPKPGLPPKPPRPPPRPVLDMMQNRVLAGILDLERRTKRCHCDAARLFPTPTLCKQKKIKRQAGQRVDAPRLSLHPSNLPTLSSYTPPSSSPRQKVFLHLYQWTNPSMRFVSSPGCVKTSSFEHFLFLCSL